MDGSAMAVSTIATVVTGASVGFFALAHPRLAVKRSCDPEVVESRELISVMGLEDVSSCQETREELKAKVRI